MYKNSNPNGRHHILVVDDEPLVRRSLSEFLTLEGYTVSSAASGKEALELLKNYTADIIITDIKMPEIDGIQLLRRIKKENADIPVILITGYGSIEDAVKADEVFSRLMGDDVEARRQFIAERAEEAEIDV